MSDEAHLPAEQARPGAAARFPVPHGDGGRPQGPERAPGPRPQEALGLNPKLGRVTRRTDYLAANQGLRAPMPGFVLLIRPRNDGDPMMRIGITVSGKVGGAVIRNRMKRRFRALARATLPAAGVKGADHILIGRSQGIERDYALLEAELRKALRKLSAKLQPTDGNSTSRIGSGRPASRSNLHKRGSSAPSDDAPRSGSIPSPLQEEEVR